MVLHPLPRLFTMLAQAVGAGSPQDPADGWAWLDYRMLNNEVRDWLIGVGSFAGLTFLFWVLRRLLLIRLRWLSRRTVTKADDLALELVKDIRFWAIIALALAIVPRDTLHLPAGLAVGLKYAVVSGLAIQLFLSSRRLTEFIVTQLLQRSAGREGRPDPSLASATTLIRFVSMLVLGAGIGLLALDNFGVPITPLVTGLGVGGIAVALAVQNILADLFSSVSIVIDKPFVVGDFIVVDDKKGTIESIGIKTTRLRSLTGEQVILSNSDLLKSRMHNYQRMLERRVVFVVNLVYETPPAKLRRAVEIIREAITAADRTRVDRVHFKALSTYSLDFEAVYYVLSGDYNLYMDIQQKINFELVERFAREEIAFAYPTAVEIRREEAPAATPAQGAT